MKLISIVIAALLIAGCGASEDHEGHSPAEVTTTEHDHAAPGATAPAVAETYWTCPMHPQVHEDGPGSCPICGMTLVEKDVADAEGMHVSATTQKSMNLRTARAERGPLRLKIETVGIVGYDQSTIRKVQSRVEGWVEAVGIDATGERVAPGDLLFTLYAPELVNAQEELLQALTAGDRTLIEASRDRLISLGVPRSAVAEVERDRRVHRAVAWRATTGGVVTLLGVRAGAAVNAGTEMLTLAETESVWVTASVFDRHAQWVREGTPVVVASAYDDRAPHRGTIEYVYPEVDPVTRALQVRISLANPNGTWMPGMWTSVRIDAGVAEDVLSVPAEAVIQTGQSTRIVVQMNDSQFEVREIVTGMRANDRVEVRSGLVDGERVVVSGQFLLDSESSMRAGQQRLESAGHEH